ncbi:hypothetical protein BCR34DRAFT_675020 [Clohesyomyces aquaticus]|uniref:Uncharacterized protein n=1 Tax=Clohesyomyces aquaticus TaxID=1231657 RepID=A0A1Y1ZED7_9PLEO|nr:hypothetical protein BCR34DRAFT_675020 [Clohesyomyces aquaticus]
MATSPLRILLENVDFRLPTQVTDDNSVIALKSLCFEPLLRWQPGGLFAPGLFSCWTLSPPSPQAQSWTYTFHIRPGATCHDSLPASRPHLTISSPEPFADVLDILCEFWPCQMSQDGKFVLGTVPYRVVEFEREAGVRRAVLRKVDTRVDGVEEGSQWPQEIITSQERDGNARLGVLLGGEVDVALNLERADYLDKVDFDTSTGQAARLAANMAVNNEALVMEVFHDLAIPSATIISPHHLSFAQAGLSPILHDPEAARKPLENIDISSTISLRTPQYMPEHAEKISAFVAKSIGLRKDIGDLALFDSTLKSTFRVLDDKVLSSSRNTWWLGYHDDEIQKLIGNAKTKIGDELQENLLWLYIAHPDVVWASRLGVALTMGPSGVLTLA